MGAGRRKGAGGRRAGQQARSSAALHKPISTLDLSGLTGVTLYEPEELVLSAKAGTPIAEIEALVAASGQQLAFEPMDYGPLLGGAPAPRHRRRRAGHQSFRPAPDQGRAPRVTISSA